MVEILVGGNAIKSFDASLLLVLDAECLLLAESCLSREAGIHNPKRTFKLSHRELVLRATVRRSNRLHKMWCTILESPTGARTVDG
jgi:hypothetical protein